MNIIMYLSIIILQIRVLELDISLISHYGLSLL